jgi:hypothetical protein
MSPQQHGVGDAQDCVDEACNVVVLLAPLGGDQALHQHQPTYCNYRRYSDYEEAGDDAHYWELLPEQACSSDQSFGR